MKKKARTKAASKAVKKAKTKKKKPAAKAKVKKSSSKRLVAKRPAKKTGKKKAQTAPAPRPGIIPPMNGVLLGFVEDYFAKVGVIALTLKAPLAVGQRIQLLGHTTHLEQVVDSMQIDHVPVSQADVKDGVGIKVIGRARAGDHVYLLR